MDEPTTAPRVSRLDLLFYTRAYNRHEISLEEWIRLTRAWAEAMERQYGGCYTEDTNESSHRYYGKKSSV